LVIAVVGMEKSYVAEVRDQADTIDWRVTAAEGAGTRKRERERRKVDLGTIMGRGTGVRKKNEGRGKRRKGGDFSRGSSDVDE